MLSLLLSLLLSVLLVTKASGWLRVVVFWQSPPLLVSVLRMYLTSRCAEKSEMSVSILRQWFYQNRLS